VLRLKLDRDPARPLQVLALGAHCDDIEIGCGGTIRDVVSALPAEVTWVVLSARGARADEARSSAEEFLGAAAREIRLEGFRDGFLPYVGGEVKDVFEDLKSRLSPDVIFTHTRHDLHQDHRLACELTWNTFRDHLILEYEIPKYDGDLGAPNIFVPLTRTACQEKVDLLLSHFGSQRSKQWFTEELFFGLMRLRGMESASPSGYAEAFYGRKIVV
jgi:LmbE family N-acetylglucosaminyl deacetylase